MKPIFLDWHTNIINDNTLIKLESSNIWVCSAIHISAIPAQNKTNLYANSCKFKWIDTDRRDTSSPGSISTINQNHVLRQV